MRTREQKDKSAAYARRYRKNNHAKVRAVELASKRRTRDMDNARRRKIYANNREKILSQKKSWYSKNRSKVIAKSSFGVTFRRRLVAGQKIASVYANETKKFMEACPPGFHVDHIVPIKGEKVTGLHVFWNMQYLPASENIAKGNRCEYDFVIRGNGTAPSDVARRFERGQQSL